MFDRSCTRFNEKYLQKSDAKFHRAESEVFTIEKSVTLSAPISKTTQGP